MATLQPAYTYLATVTHVVDGDTLDISVDVGFRMSTTQRLRLYGVDTPERGHPGYSQAREYVAQLIGTGQVLVRTHPEPEKWGRWLAEVQLSDGRDLATLLLQAHLAVPYYGGTKAAAAE